MPTIELKPHFSGYLVNPLQSLFKQSQVKRRKLGEKSIVRPVFSYYGKLIIDDKVILAIVERIIKAREFVKSLKSVAVKHLMQGDNDHGLTISCEVVLSYGNHIPTLVRQTQAYIREAIEFTTGMLVHAVDISVRALYVEQRRKSLL